MIRVAFRENSGRKTVYEKRVSRKDERKKHGASQHRDIDEEEEK